MVSAMINKLKKSLIYSCTGIKATFKNDYSFRLEVYLLPFLLISLYFFQVSMFRKMIMLAVYLVVLSLELINSAIERLADRVTMEHDLAIGFVKDAASAAVLLALVLVAFVWIACLWF